MASHQVKDDENNTEIELLGGGALESLLAALPVLPLQFGQVVLLLHRLPCYQPLVQPCRQLSLWNTHAIQYPINQQAISMQGAGDGKR